MVANNSLRERVYPDCHDSDKSSKRGSEVSPADSEEQSRRAPWPTTCLVVYGQIAEGPLVGEPSPFELPEAFSHEE